MSHEVQHNTREQVVEIAAEAVAIADELELSPADRAALLPKLCELVGAKTVLIEQPAPAFDLSALRRGPGGG